MASIIKADNIQKVSDGTNIIKKCGSTITLGSSGATIALACGASQTGFGQTYSATEFCTTVKTAPFTAVSGKGYFVNTTCAAVTVTLPASPTIGDVISLKDYGDTWNTNNVTLCNNSLKINGVAATATLNTQRQSVTLIYVDTTKGWQTIQDSTANVTGTPNYIVATGGTITTCGNYKIHTFTADGTFTVCTAPTPANNNVDYLVVAGGGGGSSNHGGGGGAGGFRESHTAPVSGCYTASPLASATPLSVTVTSYPVTVGAGGIGNGYPGPYSAGANGNPSVFNSIASAGGGLGGLRTDCYLPSTYGNGFSGGSGGGAGGQGSPTSAGSGNSPPVSPPQGNPGGGWTSPYFGGGGGGATAAGTTAQFGPGGAGAGTAINASPTVGTPGPTPGLRYFAGGGGAANGPVCGPANGGVGGGGSGYGYANGTCFGKGTVNTGGGGGATACNPNVGKNTGGSGIVIIRYKYQ